MISDGGLFTFLGGAQLHVCGCSCSKYWKVVLVWIRAHHRPHCDEGEKRRLREWPAHCRQPKLVSNNKVLFSSPWGLFAGLGFLFLWEECGSSGSLDSIFSSRRCLGGALSWTAPFSSCLCIAMDALIAAATARSSSCLEAKMKKIHTHFFFYYYCASCVSQSLKDLCYSLNAARLIETHREYLQLFCLMCGLPPWPWRTSS